MSDKEEDREFQLAMLTLSLKYEHEVTLYTVLMAIGAALIAFGLTLDSAIWIGAKGFLPEGLIWDVYALAWSFLGLAILLSSLTKIKELKSSKEKDLEAIREQFIKKLKTEKKVSE